MDLRVRRGPVKVAVAAAPRPRPAAEPDPAALRAELERLRRQNDELEHCVNALAHDLRSPLVAVLGFSRLLRQDYGSVLDDTGTHFLERIEQAGVTMDSMVNDLLELSRIGRDEEQHFSVDPRAVLTQLEAELKPQLEALGAALRLPEQPPLVRCDRTRLYQIFANLIGNAIEHMGPGDTPEIQVDLWNENGVHHLTVRDSGRGIDSADHERIFQIFQAAAQDSKRRHGAGMGLAIVRRIAETHGGRAWVESEAGRGATFHVTLARA